MEDLTLKNKQRYTLEAWVCDTGIYDNEEKRFVGNPFASGVMAAKFYEKMYLEGCSILLSLKHSKPDDFGFTFWRENDAGYTANLNDIGFYKTIKPDYHDSDNTLPINKELFEKLYIFGGRFPAIGINKSNIQELGIYAHKNKFIKITK